MKKSMIVLSLALAGATVLAASGKRNSKVQPGAGSDSVETGGKAARVMIDQYPKLGSQCLLGAPFLGGGSNVGQCYTGKPRFWTVLESKYTTYAKCMPQLTFTWHVLLETAKASNKDKEGRKDLAPYSYFSTTVTYYNIPRGSHAACVCLHPSYREVYGEAVAVAIIVSNENGDILGGDTVTSQPKFFRKKDGHKFWEDSSIMDAKITGTDRPMIERRQGLLDRSKTIWALVNPNDYELTVQ